MKNFEKKYRINIISKFENGAGAGSRDEDDSKDDHEEVEDEQI